MEVLKAIIIGLIQGLTEFLPISSSAHLVIFQDILNFRMEGIVLEIAVHLGSLLAVLIYFRDEVWKMAAAPFHFPALFSPVKNQQTPWTRYFIFDLYLILATIPAVIVGLFFREPIENAFDSPVIALVALSVTGLILFSGRFVRERNEPLNALRSLLIGVAQAFAIIPGISRSGSTIMTGIWTGLERETAAKFSFLMSIPAIFGAAVLQLGELSWQSVTAHEWFLIAVATFSSFLSAFFAIAFLIAIIKKNRIEYFGIYCILVSVTGLILYL